jgi:hypothetical protein
MSWEDELRTVKEEARTLEKQRKVQELERLSKRLAEAEKSDAMVKKLLDGVGMVQWGRLLFGRRYKVSKMVYQDSNKRTEKDYAEWKVRSRAIMRRRRRSFSVRLYLDPYGHSSYFEVKGKEGKRTTDVSEVTLQEALKDVFRDGPHTESGSQASAR